MLVEVEPAEIQFLLPPELAVEGAIITFMRPDCTKTLCERSHLCFPDGIRDGDKCEVLKVVNPNVECALGSKVTLVSVRVRGRT